MAQTPFSFDSVFLCKTILGFFYLLHYLFLATRFQFMTFDVYVSDGVDDGREFIVFNINNEKIVRGSGLTYYSQGQFTAVPSGNILLTTVHVILLIIVIKF